MNLQKQNWLIIGFALITGLAVFPSYAQEADLFLKPPQIILEPFTTKEHSLENREFSGIPSLAVSNSGILWAVWYAGKTPKEDQNNYVVVSSSHDAGNTWKEILAIDPDGEGPVRAFDPEAWVDPEGKLWIFWAQTIDHNGTVAGVWSIRTEDADSENPDWTVPQRLTDGVMMCKPLVLSSGEWILPASTWRLTDNSARVIVSMDKGKTWQERGAVNVPVEDRNYDEHMIIEKKDGTLWMLVRTSYGIGESHSEDRGISWSPLAPSMIRHPNARFFVRRLASGNLLLVKHGPVEVKTGRSHLMAFVSQDDGESWSNGLLLDQRKGVSYPDGQQVKDGTIYIIYDYNRTTDQDILLTGFTEGDVLSGNYDSTIVQVYNRRKTVSTGGSVK